MADAANTPSLRSAVAPELSKAAVSEQDVACTATRVGKHIELLGGEVIPPYECPIGKRVLEVRATVRILDERGEEIGAGDRNFAARAAKIERDKFEWMWRDPLR